MRLRRYSLMSDVGQCYGKRNRESVQSLQKKVRAQRRLLEKREAALAEKRAKERARCLHARQVLVPYGGPRNNGEFNYQCIDCGAFL